MITGKNIEIGQSLQLFIDSEIKSVVEKYMGEGPIDMSATVRKTPNDHFCVEASVHVGRNFVIHCDGTDHDAYKAATSVAHQLESRIQKYTKRLRDRKRRSEIIDPLSVGYYVIDAHQEDHGHDTPLVIAESAKEIESMTVGEAVMRMDLSSQSNFIFKNAAHGHINVVYRRNDGHVGWVDPTKTL